MSFSKQPQSDQQVATPANNDNVYQPPTAVLTAVGGSSSSSTSGKSRAKYILFTIANIAMAACIILSNVFPMWTVSVNSAVAKYNIWNICVYYLDQSKCQTYTDAVESTQGLPLCPQWNQWLDSIRGCSICGIILFLVAAAFTCERVCLCAPKMRNGLAGFLKYTHRFVFFAGFVMNMACMIMVLLLYTTQPSDCIGQKPSSVDGAKVGGSAFLFLACWLPCIFFMIIDAKIRDDDTAAANNNNTQFSASPMEYNSLPADQKSVSRI
jgi:hypothetical protein